MDKIADILKLTRDILLLLDKSVGLQIFVILLIIIVFIFMVYSVVRKILEVIQDFKYEKAIKANNALLIEIKIFLNTLTSKLNRG